MRLGSKQCAALAALEEDGPMSRPQLCRAAHPWGRGSPSVTMLAARGLIKVTGRGDNSVCEITERGKKALQNNLLARVILAAGKDPTEG
jgi:hypothetical protein